MRKTGRKALFRNARTLLSALRRISTWVKSYKQNFEISRRSFFLPADPAAKFLLLFRWLAGSDFDAARKAPFVVVKKIDDYSGDIGWLQLPGLILGERVTAEFGVN